MYLCPLPVSMRYLFYRFFHCQYMYVKVEFTKPIITMLARDVTYEAECMSCHARPSFKLEARTAKDTNLHVDCLLRLSYKAFSSNKTSRG